MDLPKTVCYQVRLKTDLTHYHPQLTPGCEGYTVGVYGQCSKLSKQYVGVWFPGIKILDVNWAALEIIAEPWRAALVEDRQEQQESFSVARRLLKWVGL